MAESARTDARGPTPAAESPLLRALVARYLDPEAARAHVGASNSARDWPATGLRPGRHVIAAPERGRV